MVIFRHEGRATGQKGWPPNHETDANRLYRMQRCFAAKARVHRVLRAAIDRGNDLGDSFLEVRWLPKANKNMSKTKPFLSKMMALNSKN